MLGGINQPIDGGLLGDGNSITLPLGGLGDFGDHPVHAEGRLDKLTDTVTRGHPDFGIDRITLGDLGEHLDLVLDRPLRGGQTTIHPLDGHEAEQGTTQRGDPFGCHGRDLHSGDGDPILVREDRQIGNRDVFFQGRVFLREVHFREASFPYGGDQWISSRTTSRSPRWAPGGSSLWVVSSGPPLSGIGGGPSG